MQKGRPGVEKSTLQRPPRTQFRIAVPKHRHSPNARLNQESHEQIRFVRLVWKAAYRTHKKCKAPHNLRRI